MRVRWWAWVPLAVAGLAYVGVKAWRRSGRHLPVYADARSVTPEAGGACLAGERAADGDTLEVLGREAHVWATAPTGAPRPLVIVLHGWQTDGAKFQSWFHFERFTDNEAVVVYPDAVGGTWDVRGERDLQWLEQVVGAVSRVHCIDRSRVLAIGFSFGAKMAHHLGCKRPGLVKAIVGGDGDWVDEDPACGAPLPVLQLHRTADPDERIEWGKAAVERWRRVQACNLLSSPSALGEGCIEYEGCTAPGSVTFCEDTWVDPKWPADWNHTIREPYRALAWRWFRGLP